MMGPKSERINFRLRTRERLLREMLRSTKTARSDMDDDWKVLVMDDFTLRILSSACKMSDVADEGISLVEDLSKRRKPMPEMDAIYFIQPHYESVSRFMGDMQGTKPLYKRAYVFFSTPVKRETVKSIKENPLLRSRIATLKEMNLEYLTVDQQGFVTDHPRALQLLFSSEVNSREYEKSIDEIASRISTAFASMLEFPCVRYRAAKTNASSVGSNERMRDLIPTKVAASVWDRIMKYRHSLQGFPQSDTCDLLLLDRCVDIVSPLVHEWSYGGMCFDLLPMEGNKYEYQYSLPTGKTESKTVILDELDPIWVEMRDLFMAEAFEKVSDLSIKITSMAAVPAAGDAQLSGKEMQAIVKSLSSYRDQKDKLDLHVNICHTLSQKINALGLHDVGSLEQGIFFLEKKEKEILQLLEERQREGNPVSPDLKLRLLLIFACSYPEKLEPSKREQWKSSFGLDDASFQCVLNLQQMGIKFQKKDVISSLSAQLGLKLPKAMTAPGRDRLIEKEENEYVLSRLQPTIFDMLESMAMGKLSTSNFPFVQEPLPAAFQQNATTAPLSTGPHSSHSVFGISNPNRETAQQYPPNPHQVNYQMYQHQSKHPSPSITPSASFPPSVGNSERSTSSSGTVGGGWSTRRRQCPTPSSSTTSDFSVVSTGGVNLTHNGSNKEQPGVTRPPSASLPADSLTDKNSILQQQRSESENTNTSVSNENGGLNLGLGFGIPAVGSLASWALRGGRKDGGGGNSSTQDQQNQFSNSSSVQLPRGRRLIIFIIGGMTRSELRVAHQLSQKLNREVLIGSTSLDTPSKFLNALKVLHKSR